MTVGESKTPEVPGASGSSAVVDEAVARELAEFTNRHGLPEIEVDAALHGESVGLAGSVLSWIDGEEARLVNAHGLIEGRRRYRPVRMLKDYARKHGTGRRRDS